MSTSYDAFNNFNSQLRDNFSLYFTEIIILAILPANEFGGFCLINYYMFCFLSNSVGKIEDL